MLVESWCCSMSQSLDEIFGFWLRMKKEVCGFWNEMDEDADVKNPTFLLVLKIVVAVLFCVICLPFGLLFTCVRFVKVIYKAVKGFLSGVVGQWLIANIEYDKAQKNKAIVQCNMNWDDWSFLAKFVVADVLEMRDWESLGEDMCYYDKFYLFRIWRLPETPEEITVLKRKLERRYARVLGCDVRKVRENKVILLANGYVWISADTRASGSCGGVCGNPPIT